jgi:hypothetical protein
MTFPRIKMRNQFDPGIARLATRIDRFLAFSETRFVV